MILEVNKNMFLKVVSFFLASLVSCGELGESWIIETKFENMFAV